MAPPQPFPTPAPRRILVLRLGAIGDCLRVLPAVLRLRRAFPSATIGWAVGDLAAPLLEGHPAIDRLHVLRRREMKRGLVAAGAELRRVGSELAAGGYDVAIDFHTRLKSGLLLKASGAGLRIGLDRASGSEANFLFSNCHVRLQDRWENRVLRFLHLLAPLGLDGAPATDELRPWIDPDLLARGRAMHVAAGRPELALVAGTSAHRHQDRWPLGRWQELVAMLGAEGIRSMLVWGPGEMDTVTQIASASPLAALAPPTTLPEMMALLGCFRVYAGSNTAALHMAWMQGVPSVVLAGGRPHRTDRPLEPLASRMLTAGPEPARKLHGEAARRAIEGIEAAEVFAAVRELLARL